MEEKGNVYILTNPSFREDIIKIGITSGTVEKRMKELHTTGVPTPFEEYASFQTNKYKDVERFMHRSLSLLADNRINPNREFFNIKPEVALEYFYQIQELLGEGEIISHNERAENDMSDVIKRQAYRDMNEWLEDNNRENLRQVIESFSSIGYGYHLGTSDLRIDYTPQNSKKAHNCLMLLGKRDYASLQPSELYKLAEVCGANPQIVTDFLENLRPYLAKEQKHQPYDILTGYYNITHKILINNSVGITQIYRTLIDQLTNNRK
ncbi:MAG: GIY-YIG nuclease family protein [Rikenellaceae bacterium]|nr:GIY-YIG nuclease family protein [Rikenellaceae bacterium]